MAPATPAVTEGGDYSLPKVIFASSAGTMIEWYDFYIFGSLAVIISQVFYSPSFTPTTKLLITLATFATGFVVRPFGAAFFGRIGDLIGRKFTFLVTISLMGAATFVIGLLPSYATIGVAAPIALLLLRTLQGLALGGEYGGAAIYVAEHAPEEKRGYFTAYIQTTATLGLLLALIVQIGVQTALGTEAFRAYGWRIPFLLSGLLFTVALYIRFSMRETPLFRRLKEEGKTSKTPLKDAFAGGAWRLMVLALLGATAGQGVVWYTGQFYAYYYLQNILKIPLLQSGVIVGIAVALGTPLFLLFGALSDRIGRKRIMLAGCALAVISYIPLYSLMGEAACGTPELVRSQGAFVVPEGFACPSPNIPLLSALVLIQVVWVTMVYGPIAAFLVELFPGRVRYTSLSLPYHIGNGVFGGLLPLIGTFVVSRTGVPQTGLIYPMVIATITLIVGIVFLRETNTNRIYAELGVRPDLAPAAGGS